MDCQTVQLGISAYLDSAASLEEQREIVQHLGACRKCAGESERYLKLREALRSLPHRTPPPDLTVRLRVAASKARVNRFQGWRERFQLSLANLMRPLALPAAGGLCSALFLFSTLVPTFRAAFAMDNSPGDVPTVLTTEPTLKFMAPVAFFNGDAVVDLKIDEQGRIINYAIEGAPGPASDQLRHNIENSLLFTEFWPATHFGRPIAGTIRISFRSSHIDVRG
jgi:hypothetical protein